MVSKSMRLVVAICLVGLMSLGAAALAANVTTVRVAFWGGQTDVNVNTAAAKIFEEKNPEIKIKVEYIPSDYDTKLMTMIAAGNAPDVVQVAENTGVYADKNALVPLDAYIKRDKVDVSLYFPSVMEAFKIGGVQYAFPHRWSPMIVYYNKDLFTKNGVPIPSRNWTWNDFLKAAQATTKGEGAVKTWGFACSGTWWPWYLYPMMSFGSPILNQDRTAPAFDEAKAAAALQFLHDLIHKYRVSPNPSEMSAYQMGNDQLFASGKVAMNMTGFWAIGDLRKSGINWDVAWMPKGERQVTAMFGAAWAITGTCKDKEAAWKVVRFFTGPEYEKLLADSGNDIPSLKSAAYHESFLKPKEGPSIETMKTIIDAAEIAEYPPVNDKWNALQDVTWPVVDKYYKNQVPTALDAVREMKEAIIKKFAEL